MVFLSKMAITISKSVLFYTVTSENLIGYLHYDVIRAKPDGICNRPAETGPNVS